MKNKFDDINNEVSPYPEQVKRKQLIRKTFKIIKIILLLYIVIGILLYALQNKFLFHPKPLSANYIYNFKSPFKEVNIKINEKENLNIIQFLTTSSARLGLVLYFHGNMENINRYQTFADSFTKNGFDVWMTDYPGFGKTTGELTEKKLYDNASLVYKLAASQIGKDSIIIYGKSLGTGIASYLASRVYFHRLILETPYYSIPDLFSDYIPIYPMQLISTFKLPTYKYLEEVTEPVTIFHGTKDHVIPYNNSVKLGRFLKAGDEFITIPNGDHNNLSSFGVFNEKIDSLLKN